VSLDYLSQIDVARRDAVEDLTKLVRKHYPKATFQVVPAPEDSTITHIFATVDLDDPEEVTDLTIERELALIEAGIPVYVIPLRTPKREAALRQRIDRECREGP
jgi:hypothetical protein